MSTDFLHAQTRRQAALLAQLLDSGNNSGRNCTNRPVSIHFRKTSKSPVVLNNGRGQGHISAHALLEDLFRVIGSLDQSSTLNVAIAIPLGRLSINVVDGLADRTVPAPRNPAQ